MRRAILALILMPLAAMVSAAPRQPSPPMLTGIDALRADFLTHVGGDAVYFGNDSAQLAVPARPVLQAQALWLLQHPEVLVRIEGHGDPSDTRDHALAMGAKRAEEVRDYLVLLGVPATQISTMSWGKERPGPPRAVTVLVR